MAEDKLHYTIVLEKIDPQDWARPGAAQILQRVKDQRGDGNLILLHDAGGDRSQTVEALPKIIDYLQARKSQTGLDMNLMQVDVVSVSFEKDQARATMMFRPKSGADAAGMQLAYTLQRKGNSWLRTFQLGRRAGETVLAGYGQEDPKRI